MLREEPAGAAGREPDDVDRRRHDDQDVAGLEARRLLAALVLELGRAAPGLGEVELAGVEPARALEIVDVVVDRLDAWTADGRASLEGDKMVLKELGRAFSMTPAVVFVKVTGPDDPNDLVGRVKSKDALEAMGGELFGNSVIYKDTAYDVIDGFMGEPLPP